MRKVLSCTELVHDNEVQSNKKTEKHVYRDTGVVVITSNPGLRHCHKPGQIGVEQSPELEACLRASVFPSLIRAIRFMAVIIRHPKLGLAKTSGFPGTILRKVI